MLRSALASAAVSLVLAASHAAATPATLTPAGSCATPAAVGETDYLAVDPATGDLIGVDGTQSAIFRMGSTCVGGVFPLLSTVALGFDPDGVDVLPNGNFLVSDGAQVFEVDGFGNPVGPARSIAGSGLAHDSSTGTFAITQPGVGSSTPPFAQILSTFAWPTGAPVSSVTPAQDFGLEFYFATDMSVDEDRARALGLASFVGGGVSVVEFSATGFEGSTDLCALLSLTCNNGEGIANDDANGILYAFLDIAGGADEIYIFLVPEPTSAMLLLVAAVSASSRRPCRYRRSRRA